jgi:hypothetical protein
MGAAEAVLSNPWTLLLGVVTVLGTVTGIWSSLASLIAKRREEVAERTKLIARLELLESKVAILERSHSKITDSLSQLPLLAGQMAALDRLVTTRVDVIDSSLRHTADQLERLLDHTVRH